MNENQWRRREGNLGRRFIVEQPRQRLLNGVLVDDGMMGALYIDRVINQNLPPGFHPTSTFWQRLFDTSRGALVEAVVVESQPVVGIVQMGPQGVRTADHLMLEAAVRLKYRVVDIEKFARIFLSTQDEVSADKVVGDYSNLIANGLQKCVSRLYADDILTLAPEWHITKLQEEIRPDLSRFLLLAGIEFMSVELIRFYSPELDALRSALGNISRTERDLECEKRLRAILYDGELNRFRDEKQLQQELARVQQEFTLTNMQLSHEIEMLRIGHEKERGVAKVDSEGEIKLRQTRWRIEKEKLEFEQDMREIEQLSDFNFRRLEKLRQNRPSPPPNPPGPPRPPSSNSRGDGDGGGSHFDPVLLDRMRQSIGVLWKKDPDGIHPVGTAWVAAGHRRGLVTAGHVATELEDARAQGIKVFFTLDGSKEEFALSASQMHPRYRQHQESGFSPYDIGFVPFSVPDQFKGRGLDLTARHLLGGLRPASSCHTLHYPHENIVQENDPGLMLEYAPGGISSLRPVTLPDGPSLPPPPVIRHTISVVGGSSGAPLFDQKGQVFGVMVAGSLSEVIGSDGLAIRLSSAPAVNFALRIDLLMDWLG